jgi:hypothetical protein
MKAENGKSSGLLVWAVITPILLVLYALSSGPAQVLVRTGYLSGDVYDVLYAPVIFAFRNNQICQRILSWHDALWREALMP